MRVSSARASIFWAWSSIGGSVPACRDGVAHARLALAVTRPLTDAEHVGKQGLDRVPEPVAEVIPGGATRPNPHGQPLQGDVFVAMARPSGRREMPFQGLKQGD